jgi:hypothetical protein
MFFLPRSYLSNFLRLHLIKFCWTAQAAKNELPPAFVEAILTKEKTEPSPKKISDILTKAVQEALKPWEKGFAKS